MRALRASYSVSTNENRWVIVCRYRSRDSNAPTRRASRAGWGIEFPGHGSKGEVSERRPRRMPYAAAAVLTPRQWVARPGWLACSRLAPALPLRRAEGMRGMPRGETTSLTEEAGPHKQRPGAPRRLPLPVRLELLAFGRAAELRVLAVRRGAVVSKVVARLDGRRPSPSKTNKRRRLSRLSPRTTRRSMRLRVTI
jgi:hypothetical protein